MTSRPELLADARVLWRLLRGAPKHGTAAQRLQDFYAPQADRYDRFRERLLHGRDDLMASLPARPGDVIVELGGGTGANAERLGAKLSALGCYRVVDLCEALLDVARARAARLPAIEVVAADATRYRPPAPVDAVVFSYSLSMIDDWRGALANALAMLRPGGTLAVVDFYVGEPNPPPGLARHGWLTRTVWPAWFGHDRVRLSPQTLNALREALPDHTLTESRGAVPYLPGAGAPYFVFTGRLPA